MSRQRATTESLGAALPPGTTGVVTVDLGRIAANWRALAALVKPAECAAVVKADAYGLGADRVVPALAAAGCRTFFVATLCEAEAVRRLAPASRVLTLDGLAGAPVDAHASLAILPVLSSIAEVEAAAAYARTCGARVPAALHVCSGLNRLGLPGGEVEALLARSALLDALDLGLVMSHLASADEPSNPSNERQRHRFDELRHALPPAAASLAASDGLMLGPAYHYDLVRPGYALYGGQPSRAHRAPVEPVVTVHARVLQVRDVAPGESVGYSSIWLAGKTSRIATVAAGYADGIPRTASAASGETHGTVAFDGRLAPIVGRVSMDLTTVDITGLSGAPVEAGHWAEIVGPAIPLETAGSGAGTIGYEILTRIGRRYHRVYTNGS